MKARGALLAQSAPSGTTDTTAFTAAVLTEITAIFVCNTSGGALTFRIFHDVGGSTYATSNALYYDEAINANTTREIFFRTDSGGIMLAADDTLGVRTSAADDITFSIYGVTFEATPR